ncbi:hypothetical protein LX36DRAFT_634466, partial [Colletotrichum falcatum]
TLKYPHLGSICCITALVSLRIITFASSPVSFTNLFHKFNIFHIFPVSRRVYCLFKLLYVSILHCSFIHVYLT